MDTAARVLDVARGQLGTAESPAGSDRVKYNAWFYGHDVTGGNYPWCAVFVSWVAQQAGATAVIPRHSYTPSGAAWFQQRGQWSRTPRVGSVVYYEWPGMGRIAHVGLVETVHPDGSWTAIEGNTDGGGSRTGGQVMRQHRQPSSLGPRGGFGHPAYPSTPLPSPTPPRGFLMSLTDQQQTDLYNAVDRINRQLLGTSLSGRYIRGADVADFEVLEGPAEGAWPARSADVGDVIGLIRLVQSGDARVLAEVSSAFHQEADRDAAAQAALTAQLATLGPDRIAAALVAACGQQGAAAVALKITGA